MIDAETIVYSLENFVYQNVSDTHGEKIALGGATALFNCLWLNFSKQVLYVPTSDRQTMQRRNDAIWQEFTGKNYADLSVKYRLSLQQIYKITGKNRSKWRLGSTKKDKPIVLKVIEEYLPAELVKQGLSNKEAETLAQKVASYLCLHFPGVSIRITSEMRDARR